jgi:hypothetical protein
MVDKVSEAMTAVERAQSSAFKFGNERTEAMLRLQKELLDMCNQARRDWLTRLKSETELWTGLADQARRDTLDPGRHQVISGVHFCNGWRWLRQAHNDYQTSAEPSCKRSTDRLMDGPSEAHDARAVCDNAILTPPQPRACGTIKALCARKP